MFNLKRFTYIQAWIGNYCKATVFSSICVTKRMYEPAIRKIAKKSSYTRRHNKQGKPLKNYCSVLRHELYLIVCIVALNILHILYLVIL